MSVHVGFSEYIVHILASTVTCFSLGLPGKGEDYRERPKRNQQANEEKKQTDHTISTNYFIIHLTIMYIGMCTPA